MLILSSAKYVFRKKKASAGGGSFAGQGGLTAQHNLAICLSRDTCLPISTNLSQVILNKQICGPFKTNLWSYINNGLNCATYTIINKGQKNHVINW